MTLAIIHIPPLLLVAGGAFLAWALTRERNGDYSKDDFHGGDRGGGGQQDSGVAESGGREGRVDTEKVSREIHREAEREATGLSFLSSDPENEPENRKENDDAIHPERQAVSSTISGGSGDRVSGQPDSAGETNPSPERVSEGDHQGDETPGTSEQESEHK